MIFSRSNNNGIDIISGENDFIRFSIAPSLGGKITSIFNKQSDKEFLWRNENLPMKQQTAGADYDSNFYGGMDELLPNDIPEAIDGIAYPDHGELWTTPLDFHQEEDKISVFGKLEMSRLAYKKTVRLEENAPIVYLDYRIKNESASTRRFLWKLHAALNIQEGDQLLTSAKKAKVVDPAYSRFSDLDEFNWPFIQKTSAAAVPERNNSVDFFYLYDSEEAEMGFWDKTADNLFRLEYDKAIFPYQWYFASYGGFLDHYTAILEPCSSMPMSINEAARLKQCTLLEPGEELITTVKIYAGKRINQ